MWTVLFPLFISLFLTSYSQRLMSDDITDNVFQPITRRRVFTEQERAAVYVFKKRYMEAPNAKGRKDIAVLHIYPALFNHWKSLGKVYNAEQTKYKSEVCHG